MFTVLQVVDYFSCLFKLLIIFLSCSSSVKHFCKLCSHTCRRSCSCTNSFLTRCKVPWSCVRCVCAEMARCSFSLSLSLSSTDTVFRHTLDALRASCSFFSVSCKRCCRSLLSSIFLFCVCFKLFTSSSQYSNFVCNRRHSASSSAAFLWSGSCNSATRFAAKSALKLPSFLLSASASASKRSCSCEHTASRSRRLLSAAPARASHTLSLSRSCAISWLASCISYCKSPGCRWFLFHPSSASW